MINIRTLDVLLRAFDAGAAAARPAAPVAAITPTSAVGSRIASAGVALLQPILDDVEASQPAVRGDDPTRTSTTTSTETNAAAYPAAAGARRAASSDVFTGAVDREPFAGIQSTPDASAPLRLSAAAVLIGELVRENGPQREQAALHGAVPLLPAPPLTAAPLAHALSAAIGNSGLFYESHLAQWALQQRSQAELANEPQAAWIREASLDAAPAGVATAEGAAPQVLQQGNVHTEAALPLVRHQLNALETRQVAWKGDIWPGQGAEIRIAQDEQGEGGAMTSTPAWRTRLTLQLSSLGQLDVTLALQGDSLRLQIHAQDAGSAQALHVSRSELLTSLQQRSLAVTSFSIGHGRDE